MSQINKNGSSLGSHNKEFRLKKDCQNLAGDVFNASADAPKEYRFTICKIVHDLCVDLIYSVRLANSFRLGSDDRMAEQENSEEILNRINDLLPVLRRCRCISIGQEGEITRKVGNLKISFLKWKESDKKRFSKEK